MTKMSDTMNAATGVKRGSGIGKGKIKVRCCDTNKGESDDYADLLAFFRGADSESEDESEDDYSTSYESEDDKPVAPPAAIESESDQPAPPFAAYESEDGYDVPSNYESWSPLHSDDDVIYVRTE
jgi:hypothetical protein